MSCRNTRAAGDEREFHRSLIEAIYQASPDGILLVDAEGTIISHNQRLFEVLRVDPEAISGKRDASLVGVPDRLLLARALETVKDREAFLEHVEALYANPALEDVCQVEQKDGRTLERHSKALWASDGRYFGRVWFFRDITAQKDAERTLLRMLRHDPLTGAASRRHFFERAGEEVARARRFQHPLSLIMLDVDHFKRINDRWGHAAGDKVLKELCATAKGVLRQQDLLARTGGEEFVVLAPETTAEGAFQLAERLRRRVAAMAVAEGSDAIHCTVSLGVAALQRTDASIELVLKRADDALYEAKRAGRNRSVQDLTGGRATPEASSANAGE